ncbi:citrulline utilization hydrolase CtlX [Psychroflexus maritimus]|uniref:Amidinotransferase n=1 Tax=Psychroflexus maritimus TaxID=2714865 RepID=A0A967AD54_9FLAO|nr:arginine deiminase-related protein [Psychroflexus maritimus]NGZ90072.1 amidinotransferase [Psychroflexus maritimus]
MRQITDQLLMIRPASFRMNEETAVNNFFQKSTEELHATTNKKAQDEFDAFVEKLTEAGIEVHVVEDDPSLNTPDALFPNNWVSFHENGNIALYPMFAKNRRRERREEVFLALEKKGFEFNQIVDYTQAEDEKVYLEGTGSLILDRIHRKAYCALSPRANEELLIEFCEDFEFMPVIFTANQDVNGKRLPIYHTNVMMCVGEDFAVICTASIDDKKERKNVLNHLKDDGKEIIEITETQMQNFAGNMLQVKSASSNETYLVMSQSAKNVLTASQINQIEKYTKILSADLSCIETNGGGSARCMMAEIYCPIK